MEDVKNYVPCTLMFMYVCEPGSSVSSDWLRPDGPESNPVGDGIFRPSRLALGLTQPPVKWVPCLSRG